MCINVAVLNDADEARLLHRVESFALDKLMDSSHSRPVELSDGRLMLPK